jgi:outer membrane receptor protein involved in Fe transport
MIYGGTLNWSSGPLSVGLAMRHYEDLYVLENNSEVTVNAGNDGKFGNDDDETSTTLPPATVVDAVLRYNLNIMGGLNLSLHINNILDTEYWQTGDSYGFKPGAAQTVILNIGVGL